MYQERVHFDKVTPLLDSLPRSYYFYFCTWQIRLPTTDHYRIFTPHPLTPSPLLAPSPPIMKLLKRSHIIPGLLFVTWCISLLQYTWLTGREGRGDVPALKASDAGLHRSPVSAWVMGVVLVLDCRASSEDAPDEPSLVTDTAERAARISRNTRGVTAAVASLLTQVRLTGVVLREGCRDGANIDLKAISSSLQEASFKRSLGEHIDTGAYSYAARLANVALKVLSVPREEDDTRHGRGPNIVSFFTPFLTETHAAQLARYVRNATIFTMSRPPAPEYISSNKTFSYKGNSGRLVDFSSVKTKRWLNAYFLTLARSGVKAVYCEPADLLLKGQNRETTSNRRGLSQEEYSNEYYWTVFQAGRAVMGMDFVVFGAGLSTFNGVDVALMPAEVGMAAIPRLSAAPEDIMKSVQESAYYSFASAEAGYLNVASPMVPLNMPVFDGMRKALRFSASHSLVLLHAELSYLLDTSDAGFFATGVSKNVVASAALHAELTPYMLASAGFAFSQNKSILKPMQKLGQFERPTSHGVMLGNDLLFCPLLGASQEQEDSVAENDCLPDDLEQWSLATEKPDNIPLTPARLQEAKKRQLLSSAPLVLKRKGRGIPLKPFGPSPLFWGQYGYATAPPGKAVLTTVWDHPQKGDEVHVTSSARKNSMRISFVPVTGGTTLHASMSAAVHVTPWPNRQVIVLRELPFPGPYSIRFRNEPTEGPISRFYAYTTLKSFRDAVGGLDGSGGGGGGGGGGGDSVGDGNEIDPDISSFYAEGDAVFILLPEAPKGLHIRIFSSKTPQAGN